MMQPMGALMVQPVGKRGAMDADCAPAKRARQAAPLMQMQPGQFFGTPTMMMVEGSQMQHVPPPQLVHIEANAPPPIAMLAATAMPPSSDVTPCQPYPGRPCPPCFTHRFCRGNSCSIQSPVEIGQVQIEGGRDDAMQM